MSASSAPKEAYRHEKAVIIMGDKSPKAKNKAKKQDTADKNQKKSNAAAKATANTSTTAKKTK